MNKDNSNFQNFRPNLRHRDDRHRPTPQLRSESVNRSSSSVYHSEAAKAARAKARASLPDLAELIGLAFQHAQAGNFRPGSVPNSVMNPICLHGVLGSETARLVVDHLYSRQFSRMSSADRLARFKSLLKDIAGELS